MQLHCVSVLGLGPAKGIEHYSLIEYNFDNNFFLSRGGQMFLTI